MDDDGRWIVAALGNPGERYAGNRHNIGIMVLEKLLDRSGMKLKGHKSGCLVADATVAGERVVLARPTTYMNESGRPIGALVRFYGTPPEKLIVVHDEIDIPFAEIRIKEGGGLAGHNGLRSIADHLGTKDFIRVRVGVGRPPGRTEAAGHVLANFSSSERKELPNVLEAAADAVERIIEVGPERAMNETN